MLAAGEAMNVKVIYIASMGASTFGANQPQFTFPDMVCRLYLDGRLQTPPALITPGGDYDCGGEMFEEEKEEALARNCVLWRGRYHAGARFRGKPEGA